MKQNKETPTVTTFDTNDESTPVDTVLREDSTSYVLCDFLDDIYQDDTYVSIWPPF